MQRSRIVKAIFIGGCDRSGTTMLASMLGVSNQVLVTPESQFKIDLLETPKEILQSNYLWRLKIWGLPAGAVKDLFWDSEKSGKAMMAELLTEYAGKHNHAPDFKYWVDHTPANLKSFMPLVKHYERAKFIHMVRDGRAVAASVIPLEWGPNNVWEAADWWLNKLSFGFAIQTLYPQKILMVKYEDLVASPEMELERICNFTGIEYSEEMITGGGYNVPKYTRKQHRLVGKKPDTDRILDWKSTLTPGEIEIFEFKAHGMLELLGYQCVYTRPKTPSRFKRFRMWISANVLQVYKKLIRKGRIRLSNMEWS